MAEQRDLPGWPRKRLVKEVRRHLWNHGVRPKGAAWRLTWHWAHAIAVSYYRTTWPNPNEIASLYTVLLLHDMHECRLLKLPYRAEKVIPKNLRTFSLDPQSDGSPGEQIEQLVNFFESHCRRTSRPKAAD